MFLQFLIDCFLAELLLSLVPILVNVPGHFAIVLVCTSNCRFLYLRLLRLWVDGFPHIISDKVLLILRFELVELFVIWNSLLIFNRFYRRW